jgi:hypothetical protein
MQATFLSVAIVVIILHFIIPHDHHRDVINPDLKHSCPVQENHDGHTRFPDHCSMLNDMSNVLPFEFGFNHHLDFDCTIPEVSDAPVSFPVSLTVILPFKFPDKQVPIDSKLLRAPPVNI